MKSSEEEVNLFGEEFDFTKKDPYKQFKIKNNKDLVIFLKSITKVEETQLTPYKHKTGYYKKRGHYINDLKVNRQVFNYIKKWKEE